MKILVLTDSDDCAGPMAAAFLRDYNVGMEVVSAGRQPAKCLHPLVVCAMKECLVDLDGVVPQGLGSIDVAAFDYLYEVPNSSIPDDLAGFRVFRDHVKNESFKYYCAVLRASKSR